MRILITGPECTGKSTLASQLSSKLELPWFPEFARTYLESYGPHYTNEDILTIAEQHHQFVQVFPPEQALILDTFLLNLKLWSEIKFGIVIPWIDEQLAQIRPYDFVLLMEPDLPWVQDGLRESPNETKEIFSQYRRELEKLGWEYQVVNGVDQNRLEKALEIVQG